MKKFLGPFGLLAAALVVAACGSSSQTAQLGSSTAPGSLALDPPFRIASADAATFAAQVGATTSGQQLLQLTGVPACGVDFYYLKFWTVGGAKEATLSSGALMVPTGGTGCSGPRPIVLYAHGTVFDQTFNIADVTNPANQEGALIAAAFAAQGYIVVAPNYAGYDISTLGYHPFLDAAQQSGEMMNILKAARTALPHTFASATTDNGKLFITGYSEGGHVAMATQRALQTAGATVTAAAPMSGPYAVEALFDAVFFGSVNLGSTAFTPLVTTSYQHAYGNIYAAPTDVYSATYATGIDTLLPSVTPLNTLFSNGSLPQTALFNISTPTTIGGQPLPPPLPALLAVPSDPTNPDTPLFDLGFGNPYLVNNDYRASYAIDAATDPDGALPTQANPNGLPGLPLAAAPPTQGLRLASYTNDMRNGGWAPHSPTLLCGGDGDPTVFFSLNTLVMAGFWSALPPGLVTVLDVNAAPTANDPFAPIQAAFIGQQAQLFAFYQTAAGGGLSPAAAGQKLVQGYHVAVAPFCTVAARAFFANF
jgi:poly(3-hydroxybutyrate) depolymerase